MGKRYVLRKLKNCPAEAKVRYPWAYDWLTVINPTSFPPGRVLLRSCDNQWLSEDENDMVYLDLETIPKPASSM